MKIFFLIVLFSFFIIISPVAFSQTVNVTLSDTLDIITIEEETISESKKGTDITIFFVMLFVGIFLIVLYKKHSFFRGKNEKYGLGGSEDHFIVSKTKYDKFDIPKLEKIVNRLINNYRILTTIYAVLFTFVISTNLDKAFSNWAFIIWTGWTLAIIVRTGVTSLELTDILEITDEKTELKQTARKIFAYKEYVRHALYLLVPAVAFLPILLFETKISEDMMNYWAQEASVLSVAWGIFGMFIFVYWFAVRVSDFIYTRGAESFYIFAIILLVFGALQLGANSPIEPKSIVFFGIEESIPNVFYFTTLIGFMGGWVGMIVVGRFFIEMLWDKIKKKRNDSKTKKESL